MRYVPHILRRLFQPVMTPMESSHQDTIGIFAGDPISRDVDAAILEHERTGQEARESYEQRLRVTLDDLLQRIGPKI